MFDKLLAFVKEKCNCSLIGMYELHEDVIPLDVFSCITTNVQVEVLKDYLLKNELVIINQSTAIYQLVGHTICDRVMVFPVTVLKRTVYLLMGLSSSYNIDVLFDLESFIKQVSSFVSSNLSQEVEYKCLQQDSTRSNIDSLTRLFNRSYLSLIDINQYRYVAILDVDHFKLINDMKGHRYGDEAIRSIGDLIRRHLIDGIAVRYGGDEFVVFFKTNNIERIKVFYNAVLKNFQSRFDTTLSCGVSVIKNNWQNSVEQADKMLYMAKAKGKGRMEIL